MSTGGGRVLVVGSVNVDLVVAGEHLPAPGETVLGGTFRRFHGGKGGNQATAAARLGARTMIVAAVGDDDLGADARAALARDGVGLDMLITLPGVPTGVALILVAADAENMISVAPGANARLTPAHVATAFARLGPHPGDVILVTHEIPTESAREALLRGRAAGATTVLNPAPAGGIGPELLAATDLLTPNRGELALLLGAAGVEPSPGADVADSARALLAAHGRAGVARAVLVSLGPRGGVLVTPDDAVELPALPVEAVDATGAGDALNGALAASLATGESLAGAARRAIVAASLSVTRAGAREGMPTREELDSALA